MGSAISIEEYKEEFAEEWDRFVLKTSANGTFLQSRRFLSYHPEGRFQDSSLMIRKGQEIIAVVPACVREEDGKVIFSSHPGSTFGGIIVSPKYLAISKMISIIELLDGWLIENGFQLSVLKQTSECFCRDESSSIEYALQHEGYESYGEFSFVVDF